MKRNKMTYPIWGTMTGLMLSSMMLCGCKEDIDESNLYTFTGEMMVDHFENEPEVFGNYLEILGKVHPSKRSKSTMKELLDARGNYTCFAPTNEAITFYLDSLYQAGEIPSPRLEDITDSIAESIVFSSIIENGDEPAYATTDFVIGALTKTNMSDRYINISYGNADDGSTLIFVNRNSVITDKDIEVENGYIHTINKVLSPSSEAVAEKIQVTPNTQLFGELLSLTGWDKKLTAYKDDSYEEDENAGRKISGTSWDGQYPEKRYIGYTVFVETDSVFNVNGITDVESLKQWLKDNNCYTDASFENDYESEDNAINQFVAYHLLPEILTWNRMVIFSNERGFYNGAPNDGTQFSVNVWEYYETMGKHRRSMKITGIRNGKRINRHSIYNQVTYRESEVDIEGVEINPTNGSYDNYCRNGYYYPINSILVWNDDVKNIVLNERMRYDICSLLPEMITNNCRYNKTDSWYFTSDYFDNIVNMSDETDFEYLSNTGNAGSSGSWLNYQTDEFNIRGIYDFTMKLPPVPYTGTYEIRYGINANGNRGMAQVYIGQNPNNLAAVGIPLDLRIGGADPSVGWQSDASLGTDDDIEELDKAMRNNGYMKGPRYFYPGSGSSGRDCVNCLRRIIYTGQLEAGKTYWIRFKSVLEVKTSEFFYDYLEIVPRTVYNGDEPEDKW